MKMTMRPIDHSSMKHLLGYALAQARIGANSAFTATIGEPMQLRPVEFSLLMLLLSNHDVTQTDLAAALRLNAPNLTLVISRLQERALVVRERHAGDRRAQWIRLTPAGRTLARQASKASNLMEAELRSRYTDAEWAMLLELLQRASG
jgi:DNA-binding MarR family transcriptional regulator